MTCNGSFGHQARLAIVEATGTPASWSAGRQFSFQACTLRKHGRQVLAQAITGSRSARAERLRTGPYSVIGSIVLNVSPGDLDFLLPLILGADEVATDTFGLAEGLQEFAVALDTEQDVFIFTDCKVDTCVIRGQQPGLMERAEPDLLTMELRLIGKTYSDGNSWPASVPAIDHDAEEAPYILADFSSSLDVDTGSAVTATPMSFAFVIRNFLQARFVNSLTATNICPAAIRQVGIRVRTPWNGDHSQLLEPDLDPGGTSTITLTNGAYSTTFTFARITSPNISPVVGNRSELFLDRDFRAYKSGSTDELSIVNDVTA